MQPDIFISHTDHPNPCICYSNQRPSELFLQLQKAKLEMQDITNLLLLEVAVNFK